MLAMQITVIKEDSVLMFSELELWLMGKLRRFGYAQVALKLAKLPK